MRDNTNLLSRVAACTCTFLLIFQNGCWGSLLLENFQFDVCFHGDTDLELLGVTFLTCLEACRARVTCTALTLHVEMHYCRLHMGSDVIQVNCPAGGFVYSAKASWQKKQADGCLCNAGKTCNSLTKACEIRECLPADPIANGRTLGNQRYVGAQVLYSCNHGYYMTGTRQSTCLANGMWSLLVTTQTSCLKDCEMIAPAGTNTNIPTVTSKTPGSTIQYQCLTGYQITSVGDLTLTCTNDGQWGSPPVCWKHCELIAPAGTNTNTPTVTSTTPGSTIQYQCLAGYQITSVGDLTLTCNNDGQWGSPPVCWKHCEMIAPAGTYTNTPTVTSITPGNTIQYQCLAGYQITSIGDLTLTCTNNGQWGSPPVCWKHCELIAPAGTNTNTPTVTSTTPGSTIYYRCFDGYQITTVGDLTLTCTNEGQWGSPPVCWKHCEMIAPTGTNTNIPTVTSTTPGSTIQYQCLTGYQITSVGDLTLTCTIDGQWGSPPACLKHCAMITPVGTNTNAPTVTSTIPGSTIQYQCLSGYQIRSVGDLTLTCTSHGQWGSPPVCWKHCDAIAPTGTNTVDPTVVMREPGTVITYTCMAGFIPEYAATMSLTCSNDGSWGSPPTCAQEPCVSPWTIVGIKCRLFVSTRSNWYDSQTHCESLGANLAHITSLHDLQDTMTLVTCTWATAGCHPWFGMNDMNTEGQYLGASGQIVTSSIVTILNATNMNSSDCSYYDTYLKDLRMHYCTFEDASICEK